jgi:hypothetical protein
LFSDPEGRIRGWFRSAEDKAAMEYMQTTHKNKRRVETSVNNYYT